MRKSPRCLYDDSISSFIKEDSRTILGSLIENYHGEARTTSIEAWQGEIVIVQEALSALAKEGRIIFEYDIPRLGKRIDVVLLLQGIVFCIEFKVGETRILEADVDQVLDYALDLKTFTSSVRTRLSCLFSLQRIMRIPLPKCRCRSMM
ncbi:MAG: hypothetical protein IJ555_03970, partial [Ruminococcus sp.]|nr:hypothetical protein [Ruminococcus sp.]